MALPMGKSTCRPGVVYSQRMKVLDWPRRQRTPTAAIDMGNKFILTVIIYLLVTSNAQAYIGPGLGAGAIVVVVSVIGSLLLLMFAAVWYPIKRFLKKRKARRTVEVGSDDSSHEAE